MWRPRVYASRVSRMLRTGATSPVWIPLPSQEMSLSDGQRDIFCDGSISGARPSGADPVSYTHLDVYKRQVYKSGDSRVPTMKAALDRLIADTGRTDLAALYDTLEAEFVARKGIYPNLDYPSGPAYHLLGFETEIFTPLFIAARITGWTAHIMEQAASNALIRPLSAYNGVDERHVEA